MQWLAQRVQRNNLMVAVCKPDLRIVPMDQVTAMAVIRLQAVTPRTITCLSASNFTKYRDLKVAFFNAAFFMASDQVSEE